MPPFSFQKGLRLSADIYPEMLRCVVKPWLDKIAARRPYVFQQNSAPAHKAKMTQAWLLNNVPHHWSPDFFWGVIKAKTNKHVNNTVDSLKASIVEESGVLLEDLGAPDGGLDHPGFHHAPQYLLADLSCDSPALWKEERRHDAPPPPPSLEMTPRNIHLSFCLLLVWSWMKFFSSEKNLSIPADSFLCSFSKAAALIFLDYLEAFVVSMRLLDGGDELVDPNIRRTNVVGLSLGSKLVLVLTRLSLLPNVHDYGPLEPKPDHHFRRLLPDANRSYYRCSALIFHLSKG
ncbi:unnamed protein product [Acanthosepion pharaonis]|uniref:Transposase n=1 Tax=Acanthosepion pharaonis TaxID=158019 RepID=A0A812BXV7_ACAPH|nr:unnamed protein product [Sepia pharaonis]